ncbi:hypothetical protein SAVIM40S_01465 [Streptomyces avidinii]
MAGPLPGVRSSDSSAAGRTSSSVVARRPSVSAPACRRLRSSRFSTRRLSRFKDTSADSRSSARSSAETSTSWLRSELTEASAPAKGVRRSWLTARSRAVRRRSAALMGSTSAAASASRARSTAAPTCAAKAASTRRSEDGSVRPRRTRKASCPAATARAGPASRRAGRPLSVPGPMSGGSGVSSTVSMLNVSRVRSSRAGIVWSPRMMLPASDDMVSASAVAPAARRERRRDRSAAAATVAATTAKTTSASTLSGSLMVNSPTGAMNQ